MFGNYQYNQHNLSTVRVSQNSNLSKFFERKNSRLKHETYNQEESKIPEIQTSGRISV